MMYVWRDNDWIAVAQAESVAEAREQIRHADAPESVMEIIGERTPEIYRNTNGEFWPTAVADAVERDAREVSLQREVAELRAKLAEAERLLATQAAQTAQMRAVLREGLDPERGVLKYIPHSEYCGLYGSQDIPSCSCGVWEWMDRAVALALPVSEAERKATGLPDEVPFAECQNPDCPIGCPDSHCLDFGADEVERKAGEVKG